MRRSSEYDKPVRTNQKAKGKSCSVDGCSSPVYARQLCGKHYQRLLDKGTTQEPEFFLTDSDEWSMWAKKTALKSLAGKKRHLIRDEWNRWAHNKTHSLNMRLYELCDSRKHRKRIYASWHQWSRAVVSNINAQGAVKDEWISWAYRKASVVGRRRARHRKGVLQITAHVSGTARLQMRFEWS